MSAGARAIGMELLISKGSNGPDIECASARLKREAGWTADH